MPELVVPDCGDDQFGDARRRILFAIDDEARDVGKRRLRLRGPAALVDAEQLVRADERDRLQKVAQRRETRVAVTLVIQLATAEELNLAAVEGIP